VRFAVASLLAVHVLLSSACARPEQAILEDFFNDSRLRDLTALQRYSRIAFEPLQQGIVTSFDIVKVFEEGNTKTVTVTTDVKRPDGQLMPETLVIMMERRKVADVSASAAERREWTITGLLEKPR